MKTLSITCAFALIVGCGTSNSKDEQPAPQQQAEQTAPAAEAPAAPAVVVTKVPLDAQGNELTAQATTVELTQAAEIADGAQAEAAASQGTQAALSDELDESSAQQYHRGGSKYGYSHYYYQPSYQNSYSYSGAYYSRPLYRYNSGYNYGYNYKNSYNYNNCNYYVHDYKQTYGYGYGNYGGNNYGGNNYGGNNYGNGNSYGY